MAESPALKRKREGATPLRKKVKTQTKPAVEEARSEDVDNTPQTPVPVANGTPGAKAMPAMSKSAMKKLRKQEAGKTAATPAANGTQATPASSGKKSKGTPNNATTAAANENTPSQKKQDKQSKKSADAGAVVKADTEKQEVAKRTTKTKSKKKSSAPWSWSSALGGWFLNKDPVFTADEKHLFLANERSLHIYATDSSTLVRSLSKRSYFISAYALSATNPNHVYTASAQGLITLWDWTEGTTVGRWDIGTNVRSLAVVADPSTNLDLVYTHEIGRSSNVINVHALRTREQASQTELKQILKQKLPLSSMQVLLDGKIVIVTCPKSVMVGRRTKLSKTALQEYEYVWREFHTSKRITTFDAYIRDAEQSTESKIHVDLAIGDHEGSIWLFEDILTSFARMEKSKTDLEMLRPKRLHWHREAVASLKWSRDGRFDESQRSGSS